MAVKCQPGKAVPGRSRAPGPGGFVPGRAVLSVRPAIPPLPIGVIISIDPQIIASTSHSICQSSNPYGEERANEQHQKATQKENLCEEGQGGAGRSPDGEAAERGPGENR